MAEETWLTVTEIAARLKVSERAVRGWLRAGKLNGRNFSGRTGYRVRESELQRFLEQGQQETDEGQQRAA